jgi:DNA invertase Pin-like site-specific DNA recombinase
MKILYCRVSTIKNQKTDRQKINDKDYDLIIEDKCSGVISLFDRNGGKQLLNLIDKGSKIELFVSEIDRLGRNLLDILNNLMFFNQKGICVTFVSQGIKTLNDDGTENSIAKMMISILGTVAEMERKLIRERQAEGITMAKLNKKYLGRKKGTKEDVLKFLSKKKNTQVLDYLKRGYKNVEISKIVGIHINTITKIKKMANI